MGLPIEIVLDPSWPAQATSALSSAVEIWRRALRDDLPAVRVGADCIQGLRVTCAGRTNGPGGVIAYAQPRHLRPNLGAKAKLPATADLVVDLADLADIDAARLVSVLTHELAHALGFGILWPSKFLDQSKPGAPRYLGPRGVAAYAKLGGGAAGGVPLEPGGLGSGSLHWDERRFGNELMSAAVKTGPNPLSALTLAAMEDLGYSVDLAQAQPYVLPAPNQTFNKMKTWAAHEPLKTPQVLQPSALVPGGRCP